MVAVFQGIGNIYLYYEQGHTDKRRSPDVMVIKGVDASWERDSFLIWEEKAVPMGETQVNCATR